MRVGKDSRFRTCSNNTPVYSIGSFNTLSNSSSLPNFAPLYRKYSSKSMMTPLILSKLARIISLLVSRYCCRRSLLSVISKFLVCIIAEGISLRSERRSASEASMSSFSGVFGLKCRSDLAIQSQCSLVLMGLAYTNSAILPAETSAGKGLLSFCDSNWQPWICREPSESKINFEATVHA